MNPFLEPQYRPVLDLGSGLVIGAEVVAPPVSSATSTAASAAWAGTLPMVTRLAAQAFAFGAASDEGWWIAAGLRPGQVASPAAADAVAELLGTTGLPARRLVLQVTHHELSHAVRSGAAAALGALGVRFAVSSFMVEDWWGTVLRAAPAASVQVSLVGRSGRSPDDVAHVRSIVQLARSCGTAVVATEVDTDDQLALAGEAGAAYAAGYWWGSPGSLAKLVGTWTRLPVSE